MPDETPGIKRLFVPKEIRGTFTLGVREAEAWLYKFKQCYVALSSLIDK